MLMSQVLSAIQSHTSVYSLNLHCTLSANIGNNFICLSNIADLRKHIKDVNIEYMHTRV